jgi:hypothetical protein
MSKFDWIAQTRMAARNFESLHVWGSGNCLLQHGYERGFSKACANFHWGLSIQVRCTSYIAIINALTEQQASGPVPDAYIDYDDLGSAPYLIVDLYNEMESAPFIYSFTPTYGNVTVTVTGKNFTSVTAVTFNGIPATFTIVNDTTITTESPNDFRSGPIGITNAIGVTYSTQIFSKN